jgi:hypothetical protein
MRLALLGSGWLAAVSLPFFVYLLVARSGRIGPRGDVAPQVPVPEPPAPASKQALVAPPQRPPQAPAAQEKEPKGLRAGLAAHDEAQRRVQKESAEEARIRRALVEALLNEIERAEAYVKKLKYELARRARVLPKAGATRSNGSPKTDGGRDIAPGAHE